MKVDLKSKGKFLGEKGTPGAEDMDAGEKVKARTHRGRNWRSLYKKRLKVQFDR